MEALRAICFLSSPGRSVFLFDPLVESVSEVDIFFDQVLESVLGVDIFFDKAVESI